MHAVHLNFTLMGWARKCVQSAGKVLTTLQAKITELNSRLAVSRNLCPLLHKRYLILL